MLDMKAKKKILFIVSGMAVGGAEKFLVSLINLLDPNSFNLTIISLSENNKLSNDLHRNINFKILPRQSKFDFKPIVTLNKFIKDEKPDKIFCLGIFTFFIVTCATFFKNGLNKIVSYHNTIPLNKKTDYLYRLFFGLLKRDDLVITVSKNQAKYTMERYKIPENLFLTIYNGVDITYWKTPIPGFEYNELRELYALPHTAKVIVLTGTLRPEKNHVGAIRALRILHETYKLKAYLLFVGGGPMLDNLKSFAKESELESFVKFAGHQNDVRPFYWISDLFTLCSDRVETFSLAALEAMACGLPAVLTDIGGANEMIIENVNGLLSTTTDQDISKKWYQALSINFNNNKISEIVHKKYSLTTMVDAYQKLLIE